MPKLPKGVTLLGSKTSFVTKNIKMPAQRSFSQTKFSKKNCMEPKNVFQMIKSIHRENSTARQYQNITKEVIPKTPKTVFSNKTSRKSKICGSTVPKTSSSKLAKGFPCHTQKSHIAEQNLNGDPLISPIHMQALKILVQSSTGTLAVLLFVPCHEALKSALPTRPSGKYVPAFAVAIDRN